MGVPLPTPEEAEALRPKKEAAGKEGEGASKDQGAAAVVPMDEDK